jgi:hypothetical protein
MRTTTAILLVSLIASPQSPSVGAKSVRDQLHDLQAKAVAAAKAGDQQTRISADLDLQRLLHNEPSVLLALARAYTAAGDTKKALDALNSFADLGLADDNLLNGSDQRLGALATLPAYKQVLDRFRQNETPISFGNSVLSLPDTGLLTEDLDYDATTRTFLITSVLEHKIVRATFTGAVTEFATAPDGWPMLAIKVDSARQRVWATEVALDGFTSAPASAWGRSAILSYDLATGKLLNRIEGPPRTALGDMVLVSNGDPIVSDGEGGAVYRLTEGGFQPINTTDFISPQTPVLLPGGDRLLVPDYVRGLAILNIATGQVSWLHADGSAHVALNGVDGVYFHNQQLLLTQNGTNPQRILMLKLDPPLTRIESAKVIEQSTPNRGDPTHGVFIGDDFYYIANSGWNQLDDHGDLKPGGKLSSAQILRYSLK